MSFEFKPLFASAQIFNAKTEEIAVGAFGGTDQYGQANFDILIDRKGDLKLVRGGGIPLAAQVSGENLFLEVAPFSEKIECLVVKSNSVECTLVPKQVPISLGDIKRSKHLAAFVMNGPDLFFPAHTNNIWKLVLRTPFSSISLFHNSKFPHIEKRKLLDRTGWPTYSIQIDSTNHNGIEHTHISTLLSFLTFVRGGRVGLLNYCGTDDNNHVVYSTLGASPNSEQKSQSNWYSACLTEELPRLFAAYCTKSSDPVWGSAMKRAISLYALSESLPHISVEPALIMSCSGLEVLASLSLGATDVKKIKDKRPGNGMGDVYSELASRKGLKASPEDTLLGIKSLIGHGIPNGFVAINKIRNDSTHAKQTPGLGKHLIEAWRASQWFLEIMILRELNYAGNYIDRRCATFEHQTSPFTAIF